MSPVTIPHQEIEAIIARRLWIFRRDPDYDDMVQEAWLRVLTAMERGRKQGRAEWESVAVHAARWAACDWLDYRRLWAGRTTFLSFDVLQGWLSDRRDPFGAVIDRIAAAQIMDWIISHASPTERRCVEAYYRDGLSQQEVAVRCGCSPRMVHYRLRVCIDRYRAKFGEQEGTGIPSARAARGRASTAASAAAQRWRAARPHYMRDYMREYRRKDEPMAGKKKQLELPEMPEPTPSEGHGTTPVDPRRRHLGVERRERQKHRREERRKHAE